MNADKEGYKEKEKFFFMRKSLTHLVMVLSACMPDLIRENLRVSASNCRFHVQRSATPTLFLRLPFLRACTIVSPVGCCS
jgi:hypothetical protein